MHVEIPDKMKNLKVDVFKLRFNTKTQKLKVDKKNQKIKSKTQIEFPLKKNEKIFFVIIEPQNTYCIYGNEKSNSTVEDPNVYSTNTSTDMMTVAGKISINNTMDGRISISLNSEMIYKTENEQLIFKKLFKTSKGDVVLFKEADIHRFIILTKKGEYLVTGQNKPTAKVSIINGKVFIGNQNVIVSSKGISSSLNRSFYIFFERFRYDEEFQRSRVTFPFKRNRYDQKANKLLSTENVSNENWEFTMFEDSQEYSWSIPEINNNKTIIRLNGDGIDLSVIFKRIKSKWFLTQSKQFIVTPDLENNIKKEK